MQDEKENPFDERYEERFGDGLKGRYQHARVRRVQSEEDEIFELIAEMQKTMTEEEIIKKLDQMAGEK